MKTTFFLLLFVGLFFTNTSFSQHSWKEKYNSDKKSEDEIGYTQAIKVGNTLYVSGSVGWGKMQDAIKLAYDEVKKTLAAYGADFSNIVKENVFTTQLDSLIKYKSLRNNYFNNDFPAASWVEVRRLYTPELVIEVEIVAEIPKKRNKK